MGDCKNNQGPTSLGSNCLGRGGTTILPLYVVAGGIGNIQQRSMFGFNIIGEEKLWKNINRIPPRNTKKNGDAEATYKGGAKGRAATRKNQTLLRDML